MAYTLLAAVDLIDTCDVTTTYFAIRRHFERADDKFKLYIKVNTEVNTVLMIIKQIILHKH